MAKPTSSKCLIEIQLERPERAYKPGEQIKGRVEILPGADMKCRKVTLVVRWAARGKGPEDAADHETIVFAGGAWRNNEKVTHAFDLVAPSAPLSYEGDSFDIRWCLVAEADLPVTKDASAVKKFTLTHGHQAATEDFSWQTAGAYNPFSALGSETANRAAKRRDKPPSFYTALSWLPRLVGIPVFGVVFGYFVGMREEYFPGGYTAPIVWGTIILFAAFLLAGPFRRRMLTKRREAMNRERVRPPQPDAKLPPPPGKFWLKSRPDDSQRGWPRSIFSLVLGGTGLLLMFGGLVHAALHVWSPQTGIDFAAFIAGLMLTLIERRRLLLSWRFIKTSLALGRVEVGLTPERVRCGDELHVTVDFRTSTPARLVEATAALECYEVAEQYYRDLRTMDIDKITEMFAARREQHKRAQFARVRRIHFQAVTLATDRALLPQESASLSDRIPVPADAPPTFLAVENKVLWFLAVRLNLVGGIRWFADIPILLQP